MIKSRPTDWFKEGPFKKTNGLDISRLLWFSYRVVVETSGRTSVPNSKLSTPRGIFTILGISMGE